MAFTINAICFMHTSMILLFKTSIDCLSKYIQLPNYAKILRKNTICPINCLTQHNTTYTRWNSLLTFHNQRSLKRPSISAVWMHQYAVLWFLLSKQNNRFVRVIISAIKQHCIIQTTLDWKSGEILPSSSYRFILYSQIKLLSCGFPYLLMTLV